MSGKYSILARNYEDRIWEVALHTDNKLLAIRVYIKALFKYELVEFTVRKRKKFPTQTFKTVVKNNSKLAEAPTFGKDIFEYDPKSAGADAYSAIAQEIIEREG